MFMIYHHLRRYSNVSGLFLINFAIQFQFFTRTAVIHTTEQAARTYVQRNEQQEMEREKERKKYTGRIEIENVQRNGVLPFSISYSCF